uniref:SET domain-containing protein n=1 Tax=Timema bartmani TaxID=61472 RepID=A0A7R9F7M1_9NEOP|nr:unnamed protein product [Timema bartmani]
MHSWCNSLNTSLLLRLEIRPVHLFTHLQFDEELIHTICGLFEVNAFEIRTTHGSNLRGLYPQTAIMSHNCVANTSHTISPGEQFRGAVQVHYCPSCITTVWPTLVTPSHQGNSSGTLLSIMSHNGVANTKSHHLTGIKPKTSNGIQRVRTRLSSNRQYQTVHWFVFKVDVTHHDELSSNRQYQTVHWLTLRTTVSSNRQYQTVQWFVFKVDATYHAPIDSTRQYIGLCSRLTLRTTMSSNRQYIGLCSRLTLRTTVPVQSGQELYTSYTHSLEPTLIRRENLARGKYFDCGCDRCKDPTELGTHLGTLKCNKCDPGLILSTNPLDPEAQWKCTHCEFSTGGGAVRRVLSVIQAEMDAIEWMPLDEQSVEARERLWRKYRSVLHPRHAFITCIRLSLSQLYGRVPGYRLDEMPDILHERKIEICKDLMMVADVLEPGLTRLRGKYGSW